MSIARIMRTLSVFALLMAGAVLTGEPLKASTDRSNPSPWASYGLNALGNGTDQIYWYTFDADAGQIAVTVQARARVFSTGTTVDVFDASDAIVGRAGAIATDTNVRETTRFRLPARGRYLMRISVDANAAAWSVWIDGLNGSGAIAPPAPPAPPAPGTGATSTSAAPWTSYGLNGNGDGAAHEYWYALEGGPGDLTVHAQGRSSALSTAVTAELFEADGSTLIRRVSAIATSSDVHEEGIAQVDSRRRLLLRISIDPNAGPWSVWIAGPVHR